MILISLCATAIIKFICQRIYQVYLQQFKIQQEGRKGIYVSQNNFINRKKKLMPGMMIIITQVGSGEITGLPYFYMHVFFYI
jgi:hypothetical protein